ncbi:MAG: cobyrinate a,c-diamide synthase [Eubacterium sp.]|nr:cobyrinate a,c-diamide synthase [Eubacterium sp.]
MNNSFMIAATASGCGKTTITCGILEAFKRRGLSAASFKCGPDYIDPMFHKEVLGIPSKNLDLFFTEAEETRNLFTLDNNSQISLVEGVMGLYDGISPTTNEASSYNLASVLDIPIILVLDAKGMGRSMLAVIRGFLDMDVEKRIKGIILNRISASYFDTIKSVIEEEIDIRLVGYLPPKKNLSLQSRYLGLKLPSEIDDIKNKVEDLAENLEKTLDIDMILDIAVCKTSSNNIDTADSEKEIINKDKKDEKVRIAIAKDQAFCFYYEDNLRLLRQAGAELVEFSPLHDDRLPDNIQGIILGGGYPELYAKELSQNKLMLQSIRDAFSSDIPSLAECGGFMYLHDELQTEDGKAYPMLGIINGKCQYMGKLVRFGYVTIKEKNPSFLSGPDIEIKGHEFHYYDSIANGSDTVSVKPISKRSWEAGFVTNNHWWGFAHLYYPSNKSFAKAFVDKCKSWSGKNRK